VFFIILLSVATYRRFSDNTFSELLDTFSPDVGRKLWFVHTGPQPVSVFTVRKYVETALHWAVDRKAGTSVSWPNLSPDMNPLDYCFRGRKKNEMHAVVLIL
jgi:hypothetical protein